MSRTTDIERWRPLGLALTDFAGGAGDAVIGMIRDDGDAREVPVALFFRDPEDLPPLEEYALSLCRGRVLDVGAGAGGHALLLEEGGLEVVALDVLPEAVEVMRRRGVADPRLGDVFDVRPGAFDTLLLMMNGIGIVGTLEGLDRFLERARELLLPGGQILLDSSDLRCSIDPEVLAGVDRKQRDGRYFGEVTFRLVYAGLTGAPYPWLFVDPETLEAHASRRGWVVQMLYEDEDRQYVARLSRPV